MPECEIYGPGRPMLSPSPLRGGEGRGERRMVVVSKCAHHEKRIGGVIFRNFFPSLPENPLNSYAYRTDNSNHRPGPAGPLNPQSSTLNRLRPGYRLQLPGAADRQWRAGEWKLRSAIYDL